MTLFLINALCVAFLGFQVWLVGARSLKELPEHLLFGAAIGAALTFLQ